MAICFVLSRVKPIIPYFVRKWLESRRHEKKAKSQVKRKQLTRPDSFIPAIDIIVSPASYTIIMDLPGMKKEDLEVYRRNVTTIVKGNRAKLAEENDSSYEKNERKFGEFTLSFRIPNNYERKWSEVNCENGVFFLKYKKDDNDSDEGTSKIEKEKTNKENLV